MATPIEEMYPGLGVKVWMDILQRRLERATRLAQKCREEAEGYDLEADGIRVEIARLERLTAPDVLKRD